MTGSGTIDWSPKFGVVQDAGRPDTIGILHGFMHLFWTIVCCK